MPEPEKRFEVYVNCEGEAFQGQGFTSAILAALRQVNGGIAVGRWAGPIYDKDPSTVGISERDQRTIGNWKTIWRNDDPADRPPPRKRRASKP